MCKRAWGYSLGCFTTWILGHG